MSGERTVVALQPPNTRAKVSNGSRLFVDGDGRSAWARRFRDLVAIYSEHIGGNPTQPQKALIRRIATLDCQCEQIECDLAVGRSADDDKYNRLAGNQRRLLEELGFHGTKRAEVNPLKGHFDQPFKKGAA